MLDTRCIQLAAGGMDGAHSPWVHYEKELQQPKEAYNCLLDND